MLTNGSAALTARMIGANDSGEASTIIEQSIFLTVVGSILLTIIFAFGAPLFIRILMPSAEKVLFDDTVSFFRILILSFPFLMIYTVLASILRSSGNSFISMITAVVINIIQLLSSYILIVKFHTGITGAGVSYIIGRFFGMLMILTAALRNHTNFYVNIRNIIKPKYEVFKRIFRLGFPTTIEQILVQSGYLIANAMAIGLGIRLATIHQVSNTVYTFFSFPQGICSIVGMVTVGQLIGAKEYHTARKTVKNILIIGMASSLAICLLLSIRGESITALYSSDASVISESAKLLWVLTVLCIPAISINVIDPVLRTGGDSKYVMYSTIIGVWIFRVPLTYILCYHFDLGVFGIFLANIISLFVRATLGLIRYRKGNWLHIQI
jgi:putative MATE family efflux protein